MRNFQGTFKKCKRSFISAFSICMAVPLIDKINKRFECGKCAGVILIDLQKAFDTIKHEILL